jgi:hypothetical protein
MKKVLVIANVIMLLAATGYAFAQMGGQGSMMDHGKMMNQGGMVERGQMMGDMKGMMSQMSDMMGKLSNQMKDMPAGTMQTLSNIMKRMSEQMMDMSKVMTRGRASHIEMQRLHDRMMNIRNSLSAMGVRK